MNILLRNGHLIEPGTGQDTVVDLLIVEGRIEKIGTAIAGGRNDREIDLRERIVAPGFIDMHVHFREPGFEYKETILSGCHAAASGGFTGVCCMPNTKPAIDDESIVRYVKERGKQFCGGIIDVFPVGAITKAREGKELAPMLELSGAGAVAFSDDGAPVENTEIMRRALEYASMINKPIIQHAEDLALTKGGVMHEGFVSTSLGMQAMPGIAEEIMIARDLHLTEYSGAQYHVAHLSTAGSVELIRAAKTKRLMVTCEVTPHHFTLTDEAVRTFDTNTKMNPPLRTRRDVDAIKEGLRDGTIDCIATDHAPHSYDEKQVEYAHAPFGIVGLETAIGLTVTELVETGILSIVQVIEKFAVNPRALLHLPPVRIREGEPANLTLIDVEKEWAVDAQQFKSRSKNSPFNGRRLRGRAVGILNHGQLYLDEDDLS